MKFLIKSIITALLCLIFASNLFPIEDIDLTKNIKGHGYHKRTALNLNLDEQTATKIAELILVKIYGKDVLKQRPWNVSLKGDTYNITGTFHEKDACGGVAEIKISKLDGRVLEYLHGK